MEAALLLPIGPCAYLSPIWRIMSTTISVGRCAPSRAGTGGLMRQLQARPPRHTRRDLNTSSGTSRCWFRKFKIKKGENIITPDVEKAYARKPVVGSAI